MLDTDSINAGAACNEALLRSEIGFWRELIDTCEGSQPTESLERMQQALALAESRLMTLFDIHRQADAPGADRPSNVFQLATRRRS
jgi:hypothetical protein